MSSKGSSKVMHWRQWNPSNKVFHVELINEMPKYGLRMEFLVTLHCIPSLLWYRYLPRSLFNLLSRAILFALVRCLILRVNKTAHCQASRLDITVDVSSAILSRFFGFVIFFLFAHYVLFEVVIISLLMIQVFLYSVVRL